jgi:hypothetical protein
MQLVNIHQRLRVDGFAWVRDEADDAGFVELARALGDIIDDTQVRVVPGKRTYLARPDPIPFHTDYPAADLIAWHCEAQDPVDGASLLLDARPLLEDVGARAVAALREVRLPAMIRLGDPASPTPIVSEDRVFYAPWLEPLASTQDTAIRAFRRSLAAHEATAVSIRLRPGQVLIADNRRVLHARGRLQPQSVRRLRRFWIRTRRPLHDGE